MRKRLILFCLVVGMLSSIFQAAWAVEVQGLNVADVQVADRSPKNLQSALSRALAIVLVKISGNAAVMTLPAMQNALPVINRLVENYSYRRKADAAGEQQTWLHVTFDRQGLRQLLQNANQAVWQSNRPLMLVWLSTPTSGQAMVLAADSASPVVDTIYQQAQGRGVPIILPAMDLQDQNNAAMVGRTLPSQKQITAMGKRYGVHCVLVGAVLSNDSNGLAAEWRLTLNGRPYEWQSSASELNDVVKNGLDRAADMMANQLATLDSKALQSTVTLQVDGVQNLNDYVHVVSALRRLSAVSDVSVSDMGADRLLLKVTTVGSSDDLVQALKNAVDFSAQPPPNHNADNDNLYYHWSSEPIAHE